MDEERVEHRWDAAHRPRFTLIQVIAGAFALVVAVAGGTWAVRIDRLQQLERTVAAYEQAEKWELPKVLASVNDATGRLGSHLKQFENIERLKFENAALRLKVTDLEKRNQLLSREYDNLEKMIEARDKLLAERFPEVAKFRLKENQSKSFGAYEVVIGLVDVLPDHVVANVNNRRTELRAGTSFPVRFNNTDCKLLLDDLAHYDGEAGFTFACIKTAGKQ